MLTIEDYFMGRQALYPEDYTEELRENARILVGKLNNLFQRMERNGLVPEVNPLTGSILTSGWRPAALNRATQGASLRSKHITGQAADIWDPEGMLDDWCMQYLPAISHTVGLWLEHPSATKGWCHLQSVPPRSGNPVFYP